MKIAHTFAAAAPDEFKAALSGGKLVIYSVARPPVRQCGHPATGAAARVYFKRIEVRHPERVPEHGALLVVANHPASFTDVLLLASAIPRRLHFLAMAPTFKPRIRGFALRLCGTLPVYRKQDDPTPNVKSSPARNGWRSDRLPSYSAPACGQLPPPSGTGVRR